MIYRKLTVFATSLDQRCPKEQGFSTSCRRTYYRRKKLLDVREFPNTETSCTDATAGFCSPGVLIYHSTAPPDTSIQSSGSYLNLSLLIIINLLVASLLDNGYSTLMIKLEQERPILPACYIPHSIGWLGGRAS